MTENGQKIPDLGLKIDEARFLQTIRNRQFGIITETSDRQKMDCLKPLGDFCIAEATPNFKVALNRPMLNFMFQQSDLLNPSLPTRMIFMEDWIQEIKEGEVTGGYSAVSDDGKDQIIVISLKAASLVAFQDLDKRGLDPEIYFNGALSFMVSDFSAHEFGHAGRQTKRLLKPGASMIEEKLLDDTHSQIFDFQNQYTQLYAKALDRDLGDNALIFVANPEKNINLQEYRLKIYAEARDRGMIR